MPPEETPATPAVPAAPPAVAAPQAATPEDPSWLPGRLQRAEEQARIKLLSELGVTDPDKAKAAIAAANKAEDDAKSAAQKLGESTKALESASAELNTLRALTKDHAARQLVALTAEQQAAVRAIAGDDPAAQLRTIDALRPTWVAVAPVQTPAVATPPVTPPAPAPATTSPAPTAAPAPTSPSSPPDHKSVYADLKKSNPVAAAHYLARHQHQIYPSS